MRIDRIVNFDTKRILLNIGCNYDRGAIGGGKLTIHRGRFRKLHGALEMAVELERRGDLMLWA